ncbi:3-methyladenine DNA glycosylase AlkD [Allocatelliglobosispora scoriae]|uniref:3-methyladenine DNA glycosylase AlkD n=1 Tax=Allocatelliglobosispora scoriae TaxID=643052 RepID=A0A841BT23_9ACTN|nr:3-methyladenine DNA glycosylase AlkD [Allocatelliglobosispora scoriae]
MDVTAEQYIQRLEALTSLVELEKIHRYFKTGEGEYAEDNIFMGVRMGSNFALAKEFVDMDLDEIEKMLDSPIHDVRVGALSIMGKQFNKKKTTAARRKELFDLYIRRTDRINSWDLVDLSGHHVVGGYLYDYDQPRDVLYDLARSKDWWERRIAIFATLYFVRKGDLDDTFEIAEILVHDDHDLVQKAVGGLLREAGKTDQKRLLDFLDHYAKTMPRVELRYAIEHLTPQRRQHYLGLKDS